MYSNSSKNVQRKFVKNTAHETILEIHNIQSSDIGSYTLVAENDADRKNLSFTISLAGIVISKFNVMDCRSIFLFVGALIKKSEKQAK